MTLTNHKTYQYDEIDFSPKKILDGISPLRIGRRLYCFRRVDSTNRIAKLLATRAVPDGTIVVADHQTAGRGRYDRSWIAPHGSSILCSVVLYPNVQTYQSARITMLSSLAVCSAIREHCPLQPKIKWPNDIFIGTKKVCGILTEYNTDAEKIRWMVVGIGINVNFDTTCYPDISDIATSLYNECGFPVSRVALLQSLIMHFDNLYLQFLLNGFTDLVRLWKQQSCIIDKPVSVSDNMTTVHGIARDITSDGYLLIEDSHGMVHEIVCGDVSLKILSPDEGVQP